MARLLLPALALLLAPAALAQSTFVLDAPSLRVGGAVRTVVGAPLETPRFEALRLDLPGVGALTVSDRPFAGAARAGEFDGVGLYVTVDGTSVRLVGQRPMLPGRAVTPAFARLDLDARDLSRFVRVSLVESAALDVETTTVPPLRVLAPTGPPAPSTAETARAGWLPTENLTALDAERAALRAERLALEAERERLALEREALHRERAAQPGAPQTSDAFPSLPVRPTVPPAGLSAAPRTAVSLPDLDIARVQNAPDVLAALAGLQDEARRRGVRGDALVLYVTDNTGRVVRTAVARPLGGGLDALAEGLVQSIRFVPPVVDGQPAVVRSQVTVRFEP